MKMKRLLKEWKSYLKEGLTDVLYHNTSIYNAIEILKDNRFMTSVAATVKSDEEGNKGKFYFFSMSRSKMGSYTKTSSAEYARFVLDGQKLSQKYKGVAVDYWGQSFRNPGVEADEMEDRVVTDKPYIENASSYILETHIMLNLMEDFYDIKDRDIDILKQIEKYLQERNIPLFIYIDFKDWRIQNIKKSVNTVDAFLKVAKEKGKKISLSPTYDSYERKSYLRPWIETIIAIEKGDLGARIENKDLKRIYNWLLYYPEDFAEQLSIEIQNNRREKKERESIHYIFSFMKKKGLKNVMALGDYLRNKFDKDTEEYEKGSK